jgi:nitroreductase
MAEARIAEDRIAFLRSLRAVRSFRPDPVPQEAVDDILEVVRWSGSASNRQPWELVLIRDRETLGALARVEGYANHLADAPLGIVLVMAGERPTQETYDEGRLAERIMLAALAHGVGSSVGWIVGAAETPQGRSSASPRFVWCAPRSLWATRTKEHGAGGPVRRANPSPRSCTRSSTASARRRSRTLPRPSPQYRVAGDL